MITLLNNSLNYLHPPAPTLSIVSSSTAPLILRVAFIGRKTVFNLSALSLPQLQLCHRHCSHNYNKLRRCHNKRHENRVSIHTASRPGADTTTKKSERVNRFLQNFDRNSMASANNNLEKNGNCEESTDNICLNKGVGGQDGMDRFYFLIDIGANLTNKKFSRDVDSVVQVTGTNILVSKEALRLTRLFPDTLFATAGIHPHDAKTFDETSIQEIESLCSNPEVVALGEIGLDFNRNFSPPEVQLEVFEKQVQLACRIKMPVFLHERDAHEEMINVLMKYQDKLPPSVLHCFTGTVSQAKAYVDLGLYIGLTGYVWKDKSEDGVRKMLMDNVIPLDRLLIETDCPFMYPNFRSAKLTPEMKQVLTQRSLNYLNRNCTFQRNEPCSLPATLEMISALMKKNPEEVAMATTYNAVKIFGLSS
ncbi:3'-5' ssDNA/RNA exonuclease TatD isoform X2 [Folsomia candida]|uniref:3'-5' ssDNA/RNA exonuclease TatD isoform X2 n=1 Tax=Folsomia candida TaxID=158441 RepID=UPI000B909193|nr:3'-5' ssDNA/RNA exonuclease TatD isoform X2 [Folsomia candida]